MLGNYFLPSKIVIFFNRKCSKCSRTKSCRTNSFFAGSRIPLWKWGIYFTYWANGATIRFIKEDLNIARGTVVDMQNFMRGRLVYYHSFHELSVRFYIKKLFSRMFVSFILCFFCDKKYENWSYLSNYSILLLFLNNWTWSSTPSHPFSGICRDAIEGLVYGVQGMMIAVETFRVRKQLIILILCFEKDTTKSCEKVVWYGKVQYFAYIG